MMVEAIQPPPVQQLGHQNLGIQVNHALSCGLKIHIYILKVVSSKN
jgi:hypothetical protein